MIPLNFVPVNAGEGKTMHILCVGEILPGLDAAVVSECGVRDGVDCIFTYVLPMEEPTTK